MKITAIELFTHSPTPVCTLSFMDYARENPYNIKALFGLDADEIVNQHFSGGPGSNGGSYMLALEKREVVLRIELNPRFGVDETPSDLRDHIYKNIVSSRNGQVRLAFLWGTGVIAQLFGVVTKLEAALFSKTPEIQITLMCDDPMLRSPNVYNINLGGQSPEFSYTDSHSTAPHEFTLLLRAMSSGDSLLVFDPTDPSWSFGLSRSTSFELNDFVRISSVQTDRHVAVERNGVWTQLADLIIPGSRFPILYPGLNRFRAEGRVNWSWQYLRHRRTYWGV